MKITLDLEKIEQSLPLVKDGLLRCLEGAALGLSYDVEANFKTVDMLEMEVMYALLKAVITTAQEQGYVRGYTTPFKDKVSQAKKEDTRARRVEKMKQMLSAGKVIS